MEREIPAKILSKKFIIQMETPPQLYKGDDRYHYGQISVAYDRIPFEPGTVNLDFGGGRGTAVTEYLAERGVKNLIYDPFNQSKTHNMLVLRQLRRIHGADTVTCFNVLNCIKEPSVRLAVIRNCYRALKPKGRAYFFNQPGHGKMPFIHDGRYVGNAPVKRFIPYLREVFPFVYSHSLHLEARKIINKEFEVEPWIVDGYYYD